MAKKTETRPSTGNINPFGLRMQPELRERLEFAASQSGRSLNAEIVSRLEVSFSVDKRNAFELLKKAMKVIESTDRSIARFDDDIAALNEGNAEPLEWLIDGGSGRDRRSHEEAIDAARHIQSLLKEEVFKARRFVPTLMSAIKNGGPIPVEIQEFLSRA